MLCVNQNSSESQRKHKKVLFYQIYFTTTAAVIESLLVFHKFYKLDLIQLCRIFFSSSSQSRFNLLKEQNFSLRQTRSTVNYVLIQVIITAELSLLRWKIAVIRGLRGGGKKMLGQA